MRRWMRLNSVDNVTVTGNAGGPWTVTFGGTQSNTNVSRLDGDASAATQWHARAHA